MGERPESRELPKAHDHWQIQLDILMEAAQRRHQNKIRLRPKRDALWLWKPLHWLLRLVTLGQSIDLVDGNYYALLGRTLWLPGDGSSHHQRASYLLLSIMSHEIDHLDWLYFGDRNARLKPIESLKATSPWFRLLHTIKYLCWPLPFKMARYREQIEIWGHERNLEQHVAFNQGQCARWYRKWLVMQFSSATYAWICTQNRAFHIVDAMIARIEDAYKRGELSMYEFSEEEDAPPAECEP